MDACMSMKHESMQCHGIACTINSPPGTDPALHIRQNDCRYVLKVSVLHLHVPVHLIINSGN